MARWHDKPHVQTWEMQEEYVAEMLRQDYDCGRFVARQVADERVPVRVVSTTGFATEWFGIDMLRRPYEASMHNALRSTVTDLPRSFPMEGDVWQVWTGQAWQDLAQPCPRRA
ncbi:hypothetical protein GCM10029978_066800 [Actinoallomurus acanthiterrae]